MKELVALIKTNLIMRKNIFFKKENEKVWTIIKRTFLLFLFYLSVDYQIVNCFSVLKEVNGQGVIFKLILQIQFVVIVSLSLRTIVNELYLSSDWRDIYIYPVRPDKVLLSKCIVFYINNLIIVALFLVFLFTYGILNHESIVFFLKVIIYQLLVATIPVIYIILISMTILYIVGIVRKCIRLRSRGSLIILLDVMVGGISYILYSKAILQTNFIFDMLVKDSLQVLIYIELVLLFIASIYLCCGKLYVLIMKSGIMKIESKSKGDITFKRHNVIVSNIMRDTKLLLRIPIVRSNCITVNQIYNVIILGALIIFNQQMVEFTNGDYFWKDVLILTLAVWYFTFINFVTSMGFERELDDLRELRVFPIRPIEFLMSKIILSFASNLLSFINLNIFAVIMADGIVDFLLYEVLIIIWLSVVVFVNIDYKSVKNESNDYKEVFSIEKAFGKTKYFNIFLVLWVAYIIVNYLVVDNIGNVLMGQINYGLLFVLGIFILGIVCRKMRKAFN